MKFCKSSHKPWHGSIQTQRDVAWLLDCQARLSRPKQLKDFESEASLSHWISVAYSWDIELMKIRTSLVSKSMLPWIFFFYLCVALCVGIAQGVLEACKRWLSSPKVTVKHKVSVPKSFSRSEKGSHAKHHGVHRKRVLIAIPHRSRFSHISTPRPWQTSFVTKSSKWETASKDVKKFGHLESFKFQWST